MLELVLEESLFGRFDGNRLCHLSSGGTCPLAELQSVLKGSDLIHKGDSAIVQLDFLNNSLLLSTLKSSLVVHFGSNEIKKIGSKARDGRYGACFHPGTSMG